jgi:hypothetical protein
LKSEAFSGRSRWNTGNTMTPPTAKAATSPLVRPGLLSIFQSSSAQITLDRSENFVLHQLSIAR